MAFLTEQTFIDKVNSKTTREKMQSRLTFQLEKRFTDAHQRFAAKKSDSDPTLIERGTLEVYANPPEKETQNAESQADVSQKQQVWEGWCR